MLALRDDGRSGGGCDGSAVFCGFTEFADHGDLLDIIDFDDLFDVAGDLLPELEIDPEMLAGDLSDHTNPCLTSEKTESEEVVSKRGVVTYEGESDRKRKCWSKNKEGKRKVKVDWTPELHRRFVEAVEQLGVDKAVPSRILELMGVHCLTRHNVASHLQKYRSHRKHLQAREAEAANWTRKRHMDRTKNGNAAPTMGFPSQPQLRVHHFRPLHVWGHPTVWRPKHLPNPRFWVSDDWQRVSSIHNGLLVAAGIPQAMPRYKVDYHGFGTSALLDLHPTKESVDAAIGDVLTKPWQPLPLGLKPPAVDSVMTELHRHGVSKVPPTASCA